MDERKAAHIAAAFVLKSGTTPLTKLKLMKLMYLAERECLAMHGHPMIYDHLVCMPHGPVLSVTLNLINYQDDSHDWRDVLRKPDRSHRVLLQAGVKKSDLGALSENDRVVIGRTWRRFGGLHTNSLSAYTHTLPEYSNPGGTSKKLEYSTVLKALGMPRRMAQDVAKDIESWQAMQNHLALT